MELRTPFKAHSDHANVMLYNMDLTSMMKAAYSQDIGNQLLNMIQNSNFTDCGMGGTEYQRAQDMLQTLRDLRCGEAAKVLFVQALAHHHGVMDECRKNFPSPSGDENIFNSNAWEQNFEIVRTVIGAPLAAARDARVEAFKRAPAMWAA